MSSMYQQKGVVYFIQRFGLAAAGNSVVGLKLKTV